MSADLLDLIDHTYAGLLWITGRAPPASDPHFRSVDYLLNGLLREAPPLGGGRVNLFFAKSFGGDFFVLHAPDDPGLADKVRRTAAVIPPAVLRGNRVLHIPGSGSLGEGVFDHIGDLEVVRA